MKMQIVLVRLRLAGELAQRLAHQPGLQADVAVAHLALDLGAGRECGHRVDDDHVDGAGAHEHVDDLERLLAGVGLADQQLVDVDTDRPRRTPDPSRARRRCRRRCRRCVAPRPPRAWPAWTCPTTRGRRSRRRGPAAGRRRQGRGRATAPRSGWPRSPSTPFSPIRMIEPLPNCLSMLPTPYRVPSHDRGRRGSVVLCHLLPAFRHACRGLRSIVARSWGGRGVG